MISQFLDFHLIIFVGLEIFRNFSQYPQTKLLKPIHTSLLQAAISYINQIDGIDVFTVSKYCLSCQDLPIQNPCNLKVR